MSALSVLWTSLVMIILFYVLLYTYTLRAYKNAKSIARSKKKTIMYRLTYDLLLFISLLMLISTWLVTRSYSLINVLLFVSLVGIISLILLLSVVLQESSGYMSRVFSSESTIYGKDALLWAKRTIMSYGLLVIFLTAILTTSFY